MDILNKEYTNNLTFRIIVFLSLFTLFLSNNLSGEYFYFSCYALILTFGIIHGANDILLLMKGKTADKKTVINKTLKYFSIVVLICLVFFNLPVISLLFLPQDAAFRAILTFSVCTVISGFYGTAIIGGVIGDFLGATICMTEEVLTSRSFGISQRGEHCRETLSTWWWSPRFANPILPRRKVDLAESNC